MSDNLKLWDSVQQTDPKYTTKVTGSKFGATSINPMYLAKKATEQWGPMGTGWGTNTLSEETEIIGTTVLFHLHLELWYMVGDERKSVNHRSSIKVAYRTNNDKDLVDEEARKKCHTNATSKCLSLLGFSADVWLKYYNSEDYVHQMETEHKAEDVAEKNASVYRELLSILKTYCACESDTDKLTVCQWAMEDKSLDLGMLRVAPKISEQIKDTLRAKIKEGTEPHTILNQAKEWSDATAK